MEAMMTNGNGEQREIPQWLRDWPDDLVVHKYHYMMGWITCLSHIENGNEVGTAAEAEEEQQVIGEEIIRRGLAPDAFKHS
jgi:hypothetical protein